MRSSEPAAAVALVGRLSLDNYRAVYTPRVLLLSVLPRVVLQVAFFTLIARHVAGVEGLRYAYAGLTVHIVVLSTVVKGPDVLVDEKVMGTLPRVRLGRVPLVALLAVRWWVFAVEGLVTAVVAIVGVGLLFGEVRLLTDLLGMLHVHALVALSTVGVGIAVAAASVGKRADVLATNLASYMLLVTSGAVGPASALGPLAEVVRLLPLTNGIMALRAGLEGQPHAGLLAAEVAVGLAWGLVGAGLLWLQALRARRSGIDDFH